MRRRTLTMHSRLGPASGDGSAPASGGKPNDVAASAGGVTTAFTPFLGAFFIENMPVLMLRLVEVGDGGAVLGALAEGVVWFRSSSDAARVSRCMHMMMFWRTCINYGDGCAHWDRPHVRELLGREEAGRVEGLVAAIHALGAVKRAGQALRLLLRHCNL